MSLRGHSQSSLIGRHSDNTYRSTAKYVAVFLLGVVLGDSLLDSIRPKRQAVETVSRYPEPDATLRLLASLDMSKYADAVKSNALTVCQGKRLSMFFSTLFFTSSGRVSRSVLRNRTGRQNTCRGLEDPCPRSMCVLYLGTKHPFLQAQIIQPQGVATRRRKRKSGSNDKVHSEERNPDVSTNVDVPALRPPPPQPPAASAGATPTNMLCGSMARSERLRDVYYTSRNEQHTFNATGVLPSPPACSGYVPTPDDVPSTWGLTQQHLKETLPITSAARETRFIKQTLSLAQVKELRDTGVAEQLYIDTQDKILYCVVPKAGCTTYKSWLLYNAGLYNGKGTIHKRDLYRGRVKNADFMQDDELRDILNSGDYFKFTVSRSPYTRALATYLERFHNCESLPKMNPSVCNMWRRALYGSQYNPAAEKPITSFKQFLDIMKANFLPRVDYKNAHWVSNTRVCGLDRIAYDWVGRLEDRADTQILYGLTGKGRSPFKADGHTQSTSSKIPEHYTEETKRLVTEIYDNDVSLLGYVTDGVVP